MPDMTERLLKSAEPSVRFKVRTRVLGEDADSPAMRRLCNAIRKGPRVQALMAEATDDAPPPFHPYAKWHGAHWILTTLADIGYPAHDERLIPWREQVYEWLLPHDGEPRQRPVINGRRRNCASQEGNAVYYLLTLGLADEGTERLVRVLIEDQWPDGGWNCDKKPEAVNSSYHESITPLRALALHARMTGSAASAAAAERAAQVFLKRRLLFRLSDGQIIHASFGQLHYPPYWHYDLLFGLKLMAEAGSIGDPRSADALDLLESKRLPEGGWPAESSYYKVLGGSITRRKSGTELVSWAPVGKTQMNEWVTADALYVLKSAGRLGATGAI